MRLSHEEAVGHYFSKITKGQSGPESDWAAEALDQKSSKELRRMFGTIRWELAGKSIAGFLRIETLQNDLRSSYGTPDHYYLTWNLCRAAEGAERTELLRSLAMRLVGATVATYRQLEPLVASLDATLRKFENSPGAKRTEMRETVAAQAQDAFAGLL